jgi:7-cyano-7-deazaguanine synthase
MSTGILLSGGIDSTSLCFWKKPRYAFTVDYGQAAAEGEIRASSKIAQLTGVRHEVISIDCHSLGSGDLANAPPNRFAPVTEWWPYRNQFLITVAAMRAINLGVNRLMLASVKTDGLHKDGQGEFFQEIHKLVSMQEGKISVEAPAIVMTSVQLVRKARIDLSVLAWAHSCHVSNYACGNCRGCFKHQLVMQELGYEIY